MPDPSYFIESNGREQGLQLHLDTAFYPPLPEYVKDAFIEVFCEYWSGDIDITDLDSELAERAYYIGGVHKYNFWRFLNAEDLN